MIRENVVKTPNGVMMLFLLVVMAAGLCYALVLAARSGSKPAARNSTRDRFQ